jgi:hypothetical protein
MRDKVMDDPAFVKDCKGCVYFGVRVGTPCWRCFRPIGERLASHGDFYTTSDLESAPQDAKE